MKTLVFSLLVYASLCCAQPWHWELTNPNWQNPTGFPELSPSEYPVCLADVNGDGLTDVLQFSTHIRLTLQYEDGLWLEGSVGGGPFLPSQYRVTAQNLDFDPALELVFFPTDTTAIRCYKLVMPEGPWTWVERADLIEGMIPEGVTDSYAMVWGNFDEDENQEVAIVTDDTEDTRLLFFERPSPEQPWSAEYDFSIEYFWPRALYSGDFDNDGDTDVALEFNSIDDYNGTLFLENTPSGIHWRNPLSSLLGPGGGDLDGDGQWEFLFVNECAVPPYISVDGPWTCHTSDFTDVIFENDLRGYDGVLGDLNYGPGNVRVGMFNSFFCFSPWGGPNESHTDFRLHGEPLVFGTFSGVSFTSFSQGDVDGDGLLDLFGEYQGWGGPFWLVSRWRVLLNQQTAGIDEFTVLDVDFIDDAHDYADEYSSPRLGDVDGDGRSELIAMPTTPDGQGFLYVFQLGQLTPTEIITRAPTLEIGLPDSITTFEVIDLDGDGLAEILPVVNGVRHIYFFRNGHWDLYENILPNISSAIRGFADWDDNGTTDIFTDQGIFLNLTPTPADDHRDILYPLSFILSAYPNPFNAQTTIQFDLPNTGKATLKIFDLLGRNVETILDQNMTAGAHVIRYDAAHLSSGVYFARLTAGTRSATQKLLLLK